MKKKETLKHLDIQLFLSEMEQIRAQLKENEEKCRIVQSDLETTAADFEKTKTEYDRLEKELEKLEEEIQKAREETTEKTLKKQQLENQIELLKEQIHSAHMNDAHYDQRAQTVLAELENREKSRQELLQEQEEIDAQMNRQKTLEDEAGAALLEVQSRIADLSAEIEQHQNEVMEVLSSRASTKAKIQKYDTMLEQIQVVHPLRGVDHRNGEGLLGPRVGGGGTSQQGQTEQETGGEGKHAFHVGSSFLCVLTNTHLRGDNNCGFVNRCFCENYNKAYFSTYKKIS